MLDCTPEKVDLLAGLADVLFSEDRNAEALALVERACTISAIRFFIPTSLKAATPKINIHPNRSVPRCHVFRSIPTVFNHPKVSSTRFRFLGLIGYPICRVVWPSMALALFFVFWEILRGHAHASGMSHKFLSTIAAS